MGYKEQVFPEWDRKPIWRVVVSHPAPFTNTGIRSYRLTITCCRNTYLTWYFIVWDIFKAKLVHCIDRKTQIKLQKAIVQRKTSLRKNFWTRYENHWRLKVQNDPSFTSWELPFTGAVNLRSVEAILSENEANIELTVDRIQALLTAVDKYAIKNRSTHAKRFFSDLQLLYLPSTGVSTITLSDTEICGYLSRATSFYCHDGKIRNFQDSMESCRNRDYPKSLQSLRVHITATEVARQALRMLGLPEDSA